MLLLVNNRRLMGNYVNGPIFNAVAWVTVVAVIGLTLVMTADTVRPGAVDEGIRRELLKEGRAS